MNSRTIIDYLDKYLTQTGRTSIEPVEANALLSKAGLLRDSKDRPGKPLRDMLRKGQLPHAYQSAGKGSGWTIPHSSKQIRNTSTHSPAPQPATKNYNTTNKAKKLSSEDIADLKTQLEKARLKYKPDNVKYLLIAEAPPDSIERFFYYENVRKADYLFLGVAQVIYPALKERFLESNRSSVVKAQILSKLKEDGFYLLDLSELPLSLFTEDLSSQLVTLIEMVRAVINKKTKIILIKVNVYDIAYVSLKEEFENVVDRRITFPAQGGQPKFQTQFYEVLKLIEYL